MEYIGDVEECTCVYFNVVNEDRRLMDDKAKQSIKPTAAMGFINLIKMLYNNHIIIIIII